MSAIRLARGATGRDELIKIEGCYHGHVDSLLVKAGSGAIAIPGSPGVPEAVTADTLVLNYNDAASVTQAFEEHGDDIEMSTDLLAEFVDHLGFKHTEFRDIPDSMLSTKLKGSRFIYDYIKKQELN